jgi:hypothetical protein
LTGIIWITRKTFQRKIRRKQGRGAFLFWDYLALSLSGKAKVRKDSRAFAAPPEN